MSTNRRISTALAVLGLVLAGRCAVARGDGGQLRASERLGQWRVSVFTSATFPTVGTMDVSILVEDAATGRIARDASISARARHVARGTTVQANASTAAATNKLFQAAALDLAVAGRWDITVTVANGQAARESLQFSLNVAEPSAIHSSLAPWIAWPIVPIALYAVHQWLSWRQRRHRPRAVPASSHTDPYSLAETVRFPRSPRR